MPIAMPAAETNAKSVAFPIWNQGIGVFQDMFVLTLEIE